MDQDLQSWQRGPNVEEISEVPDIQAFLQFSNNVIRVQLSQLPARTTYMVAKSVTK